MKTPRRSPPSPDSAPRARASTPARGRPINYYDILAVPPTASYEDIRTGYRERIAQYHPDHHSSTYATAISALINEAWEVLGDEERRRRYDATIAEARARGPAASRPGPPDARPTRPLTTIAAATNRRASRRLKTLVTAWLATPGRIRTPFSAVSTCLDLSIHGMAFTLGRKLEVGSEVTARLELPGGGLEVSTTVVRSEPLRRPGRWKIAARFEELGEPDRRRVAEYLAEVRRSRLPS